MKRFQFGLNWQNFTHTLDEEKISDATQSLSKMLAKESLKGCNFLDAGCGSGLFSLAACRLGVDSVVSFDYDPDSVHCAAALRDKFGSTYNWQVFSGDVLDKTWLTALGRFDIVYSWGVLHHTGKMWEALENITLCVKDNGLLFISIYNAQGWISHVWKFIKKFYNTSPKFLRWLMASCWFLVVMVNRVIRNLWAKKPLSEWFKGSERGMNLWYDTVDWMGGYPFETAKPSELVDFFTKRGFKLITKKLKTGSGCNELVLRKIS
ncbi:MAG: class I SAM-dependent methyltransferase [Candidatus Competibacteraceae bacterium]